MNILPTYMHVGLSNVDFRYYIYVIHTFFPMNRNQCIPKLSIEMYEYERKICKERILEHDIYLSDISDNHISCLHSWHLR